MFKLNEMHELVRLIKANYGYDLSGYTEASLQRRFTRFLQISGLSFFDLKYQLTNDSQTLESLLESLTVNVTEMFRDPDFFEVIRKDVLPKLATQPVVRIWHVGCATGEEAFSMAILLHEAGMLQRAKIYATDVNATNLEKARSGIIPLQKMKQYTTNYLQAGGKYDFSTYYTANYDTAIIDSDIRKHISFSQHNLIADDAFSEFHLICCRNVLIYFKNLLRNRTVGLFNQSLLPGGFLALGARESLLGSPFQRNFESVSTKQKIFRYHLTQL